jgi:sugar-phosphatase
MFCLRRINEPTFLMMTTFRCSAILFDLDGVLVDSTRSVERQWRAWAREQGIDGDQVMAVGHGVRAIEVIRAVTPHLDAEAEVRKLESREADDRDGVVVMPGAVELVRAIPEGRWCVVTSGTRHLASARLRLAGIAVPRVLVAADDVVCGKPHPEPYLRGAKLLGVNPAECLVIEDAPAGIESAHAGGMKVVGITSTYAGKALGHADAVVGKLGQIRVTANGAEGLVSKCNDLLGGSLRIELLFFRRLPRVLAIEALGHKCKLALIVLRELELQIPTLREESCF